MAWFHSHWNRDDWYQAILECFFLLYLHILNIFSHSFIWPIEIYYTLHATELLKYEMNSLSFLLLHCKDILICLSGRARLVRQFDSALVGRKKARSFCGPGYGNNQFSQFYNASRSESGVLLFVATRWMPIKNFTSLNVKLM